MSATFNHGYALLIGVGECTYKPLSLPVTVKDTQAIRAALIDPELCGYPQENIQVLNNAEATREGILQGLSWLKEKTKLDPEATAIVYYSGHGWVDKADGCYYLLQHDVKPSKLAESALSAEVFTNAIREIQSDRLLVVIDSCHAAGMATSKDAELMAEFDGFDRVAPSKGFISELKQGKGRAVFTSSTGEQKSHWFKNGSMSIYTFHFLEALQGAGNQPGDQQVKVSNLMSHLDKTVNETALKECNEKLGGKGLPEKGWDEVKPEATKKIAEVINNQKAKYITTINEAHGIHIGDVYNS
jgi:uncharacterized caspase-like protein